MPDPGDPDQIDQLRRESAAWDRGWDEALGEALRRVRGAPDVRTAEGRILTLMQEPHKERTS